MTFTKLILALACLMSGTLLAQEAKVTPLFSKDLTNLPGKEGLMITVEYPPGSSDPIGERSFRDFFRLPPTKDIAASWWTLRVAHMNKFVDQLDGDVLEFLMSIQEGRKAV